MQKVVISILFILIISIPDAIAQEVLTVSDAINIAMANNHDIKIAKNNIEIADNNAGVMNSGYLPSLNTNGSVTRRKQDTYTDLGGGLEREVKDADTEAYNYGVTLNYTLFDGMARHYNYKKFQINYDVAELQGRSTIESTLMSLIVSYYQVANLMSQIENQKRTLEISSERLDRAKSQYEYGQATKLDVLRSEVDKNNDSIAYINIKNDLLVAQRNMNVILARDVRQDFKVDTVVSFNQDVEESEFMNLALQQNVVYLLAKQNVIVANYDKKVNRAGFMPKIDLSGGYSGNNTISDGGAFLVNEAHGFNANASLSWNIFDGGRTHTQVQNAKIIELNAQEQEFNQKIDLERQVSNAFVLYENSIFIMEAENKNMETNKLNFMYSKEQYDLGQLGSLDYRKSQIDLQESINRYNEAKFSAKVAELQLMRLAGLFMQEIKK